MLWSIVSVTAPKLHKGAVPIVVLIFMMLTCGVIARYKNGVDSRRIQVAEDHEGAR